MLSNSILEQLIVTPENISEVHGGDINKAYCIETKTQRFFLKINNAGFYPNMFIREAGGLNILRTHTQLKVPNVIQTGTVNTYQFLLLEWLEKAYPPKGSYYQFGCGLAELHKERQPCFGFEENNYIGSLPQTNTPFDNWPEFYANCRILPLIKKLADFGRLHYKDIAQAERFCLAIKNIFPEEKPSLLHGDLWSGNYISTSDQGFAIFDPAVYYGHREMDMAMTKLFGGFPEDFYSGYNNVYALEKGWLNRLSYAQLYPLLVHAVLFEGHYINDVTAILRHF
ncbi:fructosamine kinase family protein [Niabella sp. CJ426]|uniref:fructosamine kinase family protein n=1 Tax=Niabella sp. CJ426 TaxID=3393740 RepID=UPI003D049AC5